jgi:hypothetical protein
MGMTTDQKGVIAFARVLIEAAKKEIPVSVPTLPARYDLVLDYGGRLYRAQIKYADSKSPHSQGAVQVDLRRRKRCYTKEEIDVLLVYLPQIDKVCWFGPEFFDNKAVLHLRITPTLNGQKVGCRMADDYIW